MMVSHDPDASCPELLVVMIPWSSLDDMHKGTNMETRLGRNMAGTMPSADTLPLTQSMMVVMSPMGDHAPPLLAAIIMMEA